MIEILPMSDSCFTTALCSQDLLPGYLKDQMKSLSTHSRKAEHILDSVIKPTVTLCDISGFMKLFVVRWINNRKIHNNCAFSDKSTKFGT